MPRNYHNTTPIFNSWNRELNYCYHRMRFSVLNEINSRDMTWISSIKTLITSYLLDQKFGLDLVRNSVKCYLKKTKKQTAFNLWIKRTAFRLIKCLKVNAYKMLQVKRILKYLAVPQVLVVFKYSTLGTIECQGWILDTWWNDSHFSTLAMAMVIVRFLLSPDSDSTIKTNILT